MSYGQMAKVRRMDDEEFRQKLSEVAEWHIPKLTITDIRIAEQKKRGKGRPSNEELYQDEHEEIFLDLFNGINPTHGPEVTQIKRAAVTCEDCGNHCPNGRETEARLHKKNGKTAWRQKCVTCSCFQNPFTGEFNLKGTAASVKWNDFMRETKGAYKTQGNAARENCVIRINPESSSLK